MGWIYDVAKARELVGRKFSVVTHGGVAHMDDLLSVALLYRRAEAVYRLSTYGEVLNVGGNVLLVDFGDGFREKLPERYVVLDHHGVADPSQEPSSVVQVATLLEVGTTPLVATLTHFVDIFDRFGPSVKRWAGVYGNSLNHGLTQYFSGLNGLVRDRFLELVADAYHSRLDVDVTSLSSSLKVVERLQFSDLAESFPKTFQMLRLMLDAARDVSVALSREAMEVGFGLDFGCFAVLAVPELEPYVVRGLERHLSEARHAAETAASGRYILVKNAVAVEDYLSPAMFWNALQDVGVIDGPAFVVVKNRRDPGTYVAWRPDRYSTIFDFRKLKGEEVIFKHATGFLAVIKAKTAEEAAQYVLRQLAV